MKNKFYVGQELTTINEKKATRIFWDKSALKYCNKKAIVTKTFDNDTLCKISIDGKNINQWIWYPHDFVSENNEFVDISCTYYEKVLLEMLIEGNPNYKYILKEKIRINAYTHKPTKYLNCDMWCNNHPHGVTSGIANLNKFKHVFTSIEEDVVYLISDLIGG